MTMTLETIRAAHARIAPYIVQTPLLRLPALDDALGCEVYVKAECMQRTGAFKLRGAMNKILALTDAEPVPAPLSRPRPATTAARWPMPRSASARTHALSCRARPRPSSGGHPRAGRGSSVLCDASERFDVAARLCSRAGRGDGAAVQ